MNKQKKYWLTIPHCAYVSEMKIKSGKVNMDNMKGHLWFNDESIAKLFIANLNKYIAKIYEINTPSNSLKKYWITIPHCSYASELKIKSGKVDLKNTKGHLLFNDEVSAQNFLANLKKYIANNFPRQDSESFKWLDKWNR